MLWAKVVVSSLMQKERISFFRPFQMAISGSGGFAARSSGS